MTATKEKFGQEKCTQMESTRAGDGLEADGLGMVSVGRPLAFELTHLLFLNRRTVRSQNQSCRSAIELGQTRYRQIIMTGPMDGVP